MPKSTPTDLLQQGGTYWTLLANQLLSKLER